MKEKVLLIFTIVFLLFLPILFWGSLRFVGGDDTELYYFFPFEYFQNFTLKLISENMLGVMGDYLPQHTISGFVLVVFFIKSLFPFFNNQLFLFGCNLAAGFFCFFIFLRLWMRENSKSSFFARYLASLFYVFSNFTIYTLWQTQLFSMYLVFIFPLSLYLFVRGVRENRPTFIVWNSILISIFSIVFLSLPWLLALLVSVTPLLAVFFWWHKKAFIKHLLLLLGLVFLLNIYWEIHVLYAPFSSDQKSGFVSHVISSDFRQENRAIIAGVSERNSPLYPFFGLYHRRIQEDYVWHTLPIYQKWSLPLLPINLLLLGILLSGFLLRKKSDVSYQVILLASLIGWLITLYFFTVQIGSWGMNLFLWLNNTIPGFTMLRNMFDKFGLALAFSYAFILALSLKLVFDWFLKREKYFNGFLFSVGVLILINAYPFISGKFSFDRPLWTTKNIFVTTNDFNEDFYSLVDYLKSMRDPSRFLWLPWENTNYIEIEDSKLENHFYTGVSPLLFLAQTSDLTGKLGLPPLIGSDIVDAFYSNDYERASQNFQKLNAKYLIYKNQIPREIADSYLYSAGKGSLFDRQGEEFKNVILGEKIKDFGERYSLYKINSRFANEKIYLTQDLNLFPESFSQVTYLKKASYEYKVRIRGLHGSSNLVFLDPYHKQWDLLFSDGSPFLDGSQELVFGYANGWNINSDWIQKSFPEGSYTVNPDGSINLDLTLYFTPQKYFNIGLIVSGVVLAGCLIFLVFNVLPLQKGKK